MGWSRRWRWCVRASIGLQTGQIGIDRLTGMPNRRWFMDEADRHIDRLDLDGQVGTLSLINVDEMRRLNATLGRGIGDAVLVRISNQLRAMVRPGDIVARVGGDEIAVWQNGMDHLTAAERADVALFSSSFRGSTRGRERLLLDRHRQPPARQRGGRPGAAPSSPYGGAGGQEPRWRSLAGIAHHADSIRTSRTREKASARIGMPIRPLPPAPTRLTIQL